MPKLKTKKTLQKRIRLTKLGKLLRKHITISHLRSKWNTDKKFRKSSYIQVSQGGYKKVLRKLLLK